ncbi:MAG: M48 family metallopeptidase [bacterium]|nr:M48 family metallopeptidase [bacterium]
MQTLYQQADANIRKTWLLISLFLGFILAIGWLFSRVYGEPGILIIAVLFSSVMSFVSYWWSDKIVLAMHGAKLIEKRDSPELYRIVENLSITMGLPMPKLYVIPSRALNAFATGRDPVHGVVAVTSTLLATLEKSELEGVLAQEMSHIGNRDTLVATVVAILVGFVVLLSDWFLRISLFGGGRRSRRDGGGSGALIMIIGFIFILLAPLAAKLIQLAVSRRREFLADATGALTTRYPEGLARALEKISMAPGIERASNATAHMYFASPLTASGGKANWFAKLFMTHPPVDERLAALRGMKG